MLDLPNRLAQNSLFAQLSPGDRAELAQRAICLTYAQDETIVEQEEIWPYLLLVGEGAIAACKESSEGRSLIVTTFEPGELFFGPAFFREGTPMVVRLEAREPSRLCLWRRDLLLPALLRSPNALWELCGLLVARMEWASGLLEGFAFQPVAGRLARLLLGQFQRAGGDHLARDLTLDEMAAWAGTTREMVCRTLYRFADQGLIHLTRTQFVLTDRDGLRRLAEGD